MLKEFKYRIYSRYIKSWLNTQLIINFEVICFTFNFYK